MGPLLGFVLPFGRALYVYAPASVCSVYRPIDPRNGLEKRALILNLDAFMSTRI